MFLRFLMKKKSSSHQDVNEKTKSWYRQPLGKLFAFALILLLLAIAFLLMKRDMAHDFRNNPKHRPVHDYVRETQSIANIEHKLQVAKDRNIVAKLKINANAGTLSLNQQENMTNMPNLVMQLRHKNLAEDDFSLLMVADEMHQYHFNFNQEMQGDWLIQILPFDKSWVLEKEIHMPIVTNAPIVLGQRK